jgi:phosphoribosylaminoimidazolecarboxamide formyltransferase/IMP cyclohydrolase
MRRTTMRQARTALISVFDKRGLVDFARGLQSLGIKMVTTEGTAVLLSEAGVEIVAIHEFAGLTEALGGRVKTLHPKIHAGILALRDSEAHRLEMERCGWDYIDIVVVNMPPVQSEKEGTVQTLMDKMDIGGHALLRSAAKSYRDVIVICNPSRYKLVLEELKSGGGEVSEGLRARLAREALELVARYDAIYHRRLQEMLAPTPGALPLELKLNLGKGDDLRYGENPHQKAALYKSLDCDEPSVVGSVQLHGKPLSFNNCVDLDAALDIAKEFRNPACVIVKHANPCGVAVADSPCEAYGKARATDPDSAFGGIVSFNASVDEETARNLSSSFIECLIAPSFEGPALKILRKKENLRILVVPALFHWMKSGGRRGSGCELRQIVGGVLMQERNLGSIGLGDLTHVTEKKPSAQQAGAIFFAWTVVKHVRSNAIVIATADETVGIGAGQMSRVDACRLAISKAKKPFDGCVAASDGFFPFRDCIDELARAGVRVVVQPGGSKRDQKVIDACNELGVAMAFTGMRCFRH